MTKILIEKDLLNEAINALPDTLGTSQFVLRTKLRNAIACPESQYPVEHQVAMLLAWKDVVTTIDAEAEKLLDLLDASPESPLFEAIWKIQDAYTSAVSEKLGLDDWLYWYQYDNDMGKKAHEAGVEGDMRPIKTFEDLIWVANLSTE